jgi:hypothetical protein
MAWGALVGGLFGLAGAFANKGANDAAVAAQNEATNRQHGYNMDMWNFNYDEAVRYSGYQQEGIENQRKNIAAEYGRLDKLDSRDWVHSMRIQDFEYANNLKQFIASEKNYSSQLKFNNIAAAQAHESEQRKLKEIKIGAAFNSQSRMMQALEAEGEAQASGQAGRSMGKRLQAANAKAGFNEAIAMESIASAEKQFSKSIQKINIEKMGADLAAEAARMIKPERAPALPKPIKRPLPILQDAFVPKKPPAPVKGAMATSAGWGGVLGAAGSLAAGTIGKDFT